MVVCVNQKSFQYHILGAVFIIYFFYLMSSNKKVIFTKDEEKNNLISKIYNNFGCKKKTLTFNFLNSVQFDIKSKCKSYKKILIYYLS